MATWYIATTGNDSTGDGSSGNPWLTLGKANTRASSGDTISMAAGTYTFTGVTYGKNLTIVGSTTNGYSTTILDGASASVNNVLNGYTLSFSNLIFQNIILSSNTQIFGCNSTGSANFTNCVFRLIQLDNANAFVLREPLAGTFTNCLFYGITSSGHTSTGLFAFPTALTLNNCTIYLSDSTNYVKNIVHTTISGTITITNLVAFSITSSTSWRNAAGTATWQLTYSCLYNFGGSPSGTGVINSDPLFIDATNANFNLRPTSPCRGTGIAV